MQVWKIFAIEKIYQTDEITSWDGYYLDYFLSKMPLKRLKFLNFSYLWKFKKKLNELLRMFLFFFFFFFIYLSKNCLLIFISGFQNYNFKKCKIDVCITDHSYVGIVFFFSLSSGSFQYLFWTVFFNETK